MIDESAAVLPLWMLLSAAFGFMIGDALGQNFGRRKHLEEANEDLRDELEKARAGQQGASRMNAGMVVFYLFCGAALGFGLGMLYTQSERRRWKNVETLQQIHTQVDALRRDLDEVLKRLRTGPAAPVSKG